MPLLIGRKEGERIVIDERIVVEVAKIRRGYVQLSINAPEGVTIRRGEISRDELAKIKTS